MSIQYFPLAPLYPHLTYSGALARSNIGSEAAEKVYGCGESPTVYFLLTLAAASTRPQGMLASCI